MTSPINGFKLISPGVAFREIDNSALPRANDNLIGPVVVGRSAKGPAMRPVAVRDFEEFVRIFGVPQPGTISGGDVWRKGAVAAPTYGSYAAEAWLKNSSPLTFIRMLGEESSNATEAGKAGWQTDFNLNVSQDENGGAYGLFVVDDQAANTGSLAAVWYIQEGSITLKGTDRDDNTDVTGSAIMIKSTAANKTFRAVVKDSSGTIKLDTEFNFTPSSDKFIRKVFNTNPMLTNADMFDADNRQTYWLGSTYEKHVDRYVTGSTAGLQLGVILGLAGSHSGNVDGGYNRSGLQSAKTGWFFGQDLNAASSTYEPRTMPKLFRLVSLSGGDADNGNVKISIADIKTSNNPEDPYGTFTVILREANDTDVNPKILEQYPNVNLNPSSPNFIAAKIGDRNMVWDESQKQYLEYGIYENLSRYVRVELTDNVQEGLQNPYLVPFGVFGPEKHKSFALVSGATGPVRPDETAAKTLFTASFAKGIGSIAQAPAGSGFVNVGTAAFTASFQFPELALRNKATDGAAPNPKKTYYGIVTTKTATSTSFDEGYGEYNKPLSGDYKDETEGEYVEYSWIFSLDDVSGSSVSLNDVTAPGEYVEGKRALGTSLSAVYGWESVLANNHNRFTTCLYGGFDGVDITEMDPFRNSLIPALPTETNSSVYYTYKKAIDMVRNPEVIDHNIAVIPALTNEGLTSYLGTICKDRGDSLAIIDPKGGYVPRSESSSTAATRNGTTAALVANMKSRQENNSYMTSYDPWVVVKDSFNGARVFLPPSILALGAMATTDRTSAPWFAPAGFIRGGLTGGAGGLTVVGTTRHLLGEDDRDPLYAVGINSIAKFPQQGIVIWGQKTMQANQSATDRVNVRRLMNYLKKAIANVATQVVFEPNVQATWNSFIAKAKPILRDAQARFGVNSFNLLLDESTTTQELIDNNTIYAKISVQPTKTVEFIALDFVITNNGVGFND